MILIIDRSPQFGTPRGYIGVYACSGHVPV